VRKNPLLHSTYNLSDPYLLRSSLRLYVANVGDSRAIWCSPTRNSDELAITIDHTAKNAEEIKRVGAHNIRKGRLYGSHPNESLAVTRGFGNFEFTEYGLCTEPYIRSFKVEPDMSFIMCTDGIWDLYQNPAVAAFVYKRIQEKNSLQSIKVHPFVKTNFSKN
jgi:serine/threonine protein phosphatase PrpC